MARVPADAGGEFMNTRIATSGGHSALPLLITAYYIFHALVTRRDSICSDVHMSTVCLLLYARECNVLFWLITIQLKLQVLKMSSSHH